MKLDKWIGKYAIVTGASAGIGAKIAEHLAKNGVNVIALARRSELIEKNVESLGEMSGIIYPRKCDLADFESIKQTFKWIEENFGEINILVNNAAVISHQKVLPDDDETANMVNQTININFTGLVHCTRKAVALMKKSSYPSIIINIGSLLGHTIPNSPIDFNVYPPTKFAVRAFGEIVRQELISSNYTNIRISSISPGLVRTDMANKDMFKGVPMLDPNDVVNALLYILSTPESVVISDILITPNGAKNLSKT